MIKSIRKGSHSDTVLKVLEKSIDGYVRLEDFLYNTHLYAYQGRSGQPLKKSQLALAISRLRKKGLIENTKSDKGLIIKLTASGRDLISPIKDDKAWDGKWRIVIFDIPEQKRNIRNLFRRNLKKWGFKPLQKSVWASKSDVYQKVESYIKDLDMEQWVSIIETNKISHITF